MADTVTTGQSPFDAWNKTLEKMMDTYQASPSPTSVGQVQQGEKDPWTALLAQLWQMNPYSRILPLDPVETTRRFNRCGWML